MYVEFGSRISLFHADEACLFVPSIDLLNEKRVASSQVGRVLSSFHHWNEGENHLIFNFLTGLAPDKESFPDMQLGRAIVAGSLTEFRDRIFDREVHR